MANIFSGQWKLVESENFDEYMETIGVEPLTRKWAGAAKPFMDVTIDGGKWKMVTVSTFKAVIVKFELDKEFVEKTLDGREMKSTFTLMADMKLVQHQKKIKDTDRDSTLTHYVDGNKLIIICEAEGVVAKRTYERVNVNK